MIPVSLSSFPEPDVFIATVCSTLDDVIIGVFKTHKQAGDACRRFHRAWVKKDDPDALVVTCLPEKAAAVFAYADARYCCTAVVEIDADGQPISRKIITEAE